VSRDAAKLAQLAEDSKTPLYGGCDPEHNCFDVMLKLLDIKARTKSMDKCLDLILEYVHEFLPKGNKLPCSVDEAKKIVCPLDLPHTKYHACINDCIIYRNEHAESIECPVCKQSRYKHGKKSP
jgi:hypothetical protein